MKKSFKKSIAVLLSVLMAVCVMPFSAFAAEDVKPNVDLQFNTFAYVNRDNGFRNYPTTTGQRNTDGKYGIFAAPLDYDKSTGTLTLAAAKANATSSANGWGYTASSDATFGVGDYFTVTVRLDNVSEIAAAQVAISYTDNITPAGLFQTAASAFKWYALGDSGLTSNYSDKMDTARAGFPIPAQSAAGLYTGLNDGLVGDASYVDADNHVIYTYVSNQDANNSTSVASLNNAKLVKEDGTLGNTYANKAVLATYAFKITGTGAIKFTLADATNIDDCYYLATEANGTTVDKYQTYAQTDAAGSTGVTFMGRNENVAGSTYKVTFKGLNGETLSEADYAEGASVVIPDLPTKAADDDSHYTVAWNTTPAATATADATYTAVATPVAHTMSEEITKAPTATEAGIKTLTCDICGYQKTEEIEATGACEHVNTTTTETVTKAATCKEEGQKTVTVTCNDCGEVVSTETVAIAKTSHKFGKWTYDGNASYTSSSVYSDGTASATCSICGEKQTKTIAHTGLLRTRTINCDFGGEISALFRIKSVDARAFKEVYAVITRADGVDITFPAEKLTDDGTNVTVKYGITPQGLNATVNVKFYAITNDDILVWGDNYEYNIIEKYIKSQLGKAEAKPGWHQLLVELVYYGEAAQNFSNWDKEHPMTELLTASQKALHDTAPLTLVTHKDNSYRVVDNPKAVWRSMTVVFGAGTQLKYRMRNYQPNENTKVVVEVNGQTYTYEYSDPEAAEFFSLDTEGGCYFVFADLLVKYLRTPVDVTWYEGDTAISNTYRWSAETYAYGRTTSSKDYAITQQLMRLGNAARIYFGVQ